MSTLQGCQLYRSVLSVCVRAESIHGNDIGCNWMMWYYIREALDIDIFAPSLVMNFVENMLRMMSWVAACEVDVQ